MGERTDRLHVLVNNAGATWGAPMEEFPEDGLDKVMSVNVKALQYLTERVPAAAARGGRARTTRRA